MKKILIFTALLFLITPIFEAQASHKSSYDINESEWFSIKDIEINMPENFPENDFTVRLPTSSPGLELKHEGDEPVFLQIREANGVSGLSGVRLVDNKVYLLRKENDEFILSENNKWVRVDPLDLFPGKLQNVMEYGDNRPSSVEIPDSIQVKSTNVLYDDQLHTISANIDFRLNENYDPNAQEKAINGPHININHMSADAESQPFWKDYSFKLFNAIENMWERLFQISRILFKRY